MTANPIPTPDEALLTDAEWDALGRAVVSHWDDETPATKEIWRGFRMDLARGYRLGLAAGRTAALRSAAATLDALPACPTYPDCTAGDEPHDRHETAGATLLRLADEIEEAHRDR